MICPYIFVIEQVSQHAYTYDPDGRVEIDTNVFKQTDNPKQCAKKDVPHGMTGVVIIKHKE